MPPVRGVHTPELDRIRPKKKRGGTMLHPAAAFYGAGRTLNLSGEPAFFSDAVVS